MDAVAFRFDLGVGEVDFGCDTRDVEAAGVADAAVVVGLEVGADGVETVDSGKGEEGEGEEGCKEHGWR